MEGTNFLLMRGDDRGNKIEIVSMEKYSAFLVELTLKDRPPIIMSIKAGRAYAQMEAVVWANGVRYFEFFYHLFPIGRIPEFDVIFSNQDRLYSIPASEMLRKGDHMICTDRNKIDARVIINTEWCKGYEQFSTEESYNLP